MSRSLPTVRISMPWGLRSLVPEFDLGADHLRLSGCVPTGDATPAVAYGGNGIQFFLFPLRFIIELIEAPAHKHNFRSDALMGAC
jgi:hypothetical protein